MALAIAGLPLTGGALAKLTIKAPLGDGLVSLLVTLSAVGTTMVMLRFLFVSWQSAARSADESPLFGLILPWLATIAAAIAVPWYLFPEISGYSVVYPLTPPNLFEALWPIILGSALAFTAARMRLRVPAVPEGDLVVIGESVTQAVARMPREAREPPFSAQSLRLVEESIALLAATVERFLGRWSNAGALIVILAALAGLMLVH